jgi:orotate phosphoribosyltransferase
VDSEVSQLARPRRGHFDLGTGYHGDVWLDLDALFRKPALLRPHIRWLAGQLSGHHADAVCGPMEGGAFLALALADILDVAFLPAVRSPAPAPPPRDAPGYALPRVPGGIGGWRVVVADDAVNAGTAVKACADLIRDRGAVPVAVAALLSLGPASGAVARGLSVPFHAAGSIASQAWPVGECALCAKGVSLTDDSAWAGESSL